MQYFLPILLFYLVLRWCKIQLSTKVMQLHWLIDLGWGEERGLIQNILRGFSIYITQWEWGKWESLIDQCHYLSLFTFTDMKVLSFVDLAISCPGIRSGWHVLASTYLFHYKRQNQSELRVSTHNSVLKLFSILCSICLVWSSGWMIFV